MSSAINTTVQDPIGKQHHGIKTTSSTCLPTITATDSIPQAAAAESTAAVGNKV
jgi:hypothetical protein